MTALINASTSSGLITTADTSGTLALQSNGTTQFTVSSTGAYGQLKSATAQASTSGTSIDFTSIPSWVKRITVMLNEVSTNGTSYYILQVGAGSIATSGYVSAGAWINNASGTNGVGYTNAFALAVSYTAADVKSGHVVLTNVSGNTWISSSTVKVASGIVSMGGGSVALGGTLDRVRITTVNGTDTFDAGSINILYEG